MTTDANDIKTIYYRYIGQMKEDIHKLINDTEKTLEDMKSMKRIKRKSGEDFKVLSQNFLNCKQQRTGWGIKLIFPDREYVKYLYVNDEYDADKVEKAIQKIIEVNEKKLAVYKEQARVVDKELEKITI